jgi:transcriptional regulator with XRE-family HTH domain
VVSCLFAPNLGALYAALIMGAMEKSIYTPEYSILRTELVRIRKDAGLTQRDVARRLKVPHSWVAKVEAGERRIDLIEICRFSIACETDPTEFCASITSQIAAVQAKRHRKGKSPR